MAGIIPVVIGLAAAGAVAFAFGGKAAAAEKPKSFKPRRKAKEVTETTEAAVKAAMSNPAAMKKLIDATVATGDPTKLWNLGRTILLNAQGNPGMQAVAANVLATAVSNAAKKEVLGDLVATALGNGDGDILIAASQSAMVLNPSLKSVLAELIGQLQRAKQPPTESPGQPRPPVTKDEKLDTAAAQKAAEVIADAIKQTATVQTTPGGGVVTTLPEMVITPGPAQVLSPQQKAAQDLTEYLRSITATLQWPHLARFKEDKSKVGKAQNLMGLGADGKYGPGTASAVASLGIVPVPPFYWTAGKAPAQKAAYKKHIAAMSAKFSDLDWSPALNGVDRS